jgi:mono/diheme cytochrome c family protein
MSSRSRVDRAAGHAVMLGLASAALVGLASTLAQAQPGSATGDATRGANLFTSTYKCFACHGFDAQTGQRRLVPMNYTQDGFITFVQNSPLPQMPPYADVPDEDLADIYAYLRSIPVDAPEVEDIALLKGIRDATREAMSP